MIIKNVFKCVTVVAAMLTAGNAVADSWDYEEVRTDGTQYYLYNVGAQSFLNDDNTLSDLSETLWTVGDNSISSNSGKYIAITEVKTTKYKAGTGTQGFYTFYANSDAYASAVSKIYGNGEYYVIANYLEDYYLENLLYKKSYDYHDHYMTVVNGGLNADAKDVTDSYGQWIFVSKASYDAKAAQMAYDKVTGMLSDAISEAESYLATLDAPAGVKQYLSDKISAAQSTLGSATVADLEALTTALETVNQAIADVEVLLPSLGTLSANIESVGGALENVVAPAAAKNAVETALSTAQVLYDTAVPGDAEAIAAKVSELNEKLGRANTLTDYYLAVLEQYNSSLKNFGDNDLNSFTECIEGSLTKDDLVAAAETMKENTLSYIQSLVNFDIDRNITAVLSNPSFDYGDLSGWYRKYSGVHSSSAESNSGLNEYSRFGKYYLVSGTRDVVATGEILYQPVFGLPSGEYSVTAEMQIAFSGGHAQLTAIVINPAYFNDGAMSAPARDGEAPGITADMVADKIDDILKNNNENITVSTDQANKASYDVLNRADAHFNVNDGDIVVLSMNATNGSNITQFYPYRADNVKLYYLAKPLTPTGLDGINADEEGEAVYYNLQGIRVAVPMPGIPYIEVRGNKANKVVL